MSTDVACVLYLGTKDGLLVARLHNEELAIRNRLAEGNVVRDISVHEDDPTDVFVGCGLRGWGLHHADDVRADAEQVGFEDRWVWGVTRHPENPETVFVGTEPPMLYVSRDGGATFEPFDGIEELPSRSRWTFFHDPFHEGHIHGITIHPERPERIFAGVEHGALIYTHDGGETWQESLIGADIHRVAVNPVDADHVLAATGSGLYQSFDAGEEWDQTRDLRSSYLHTVIFNRDSPKTIYVYADESNPLYKSTDGGQSWTAIGNELPATGPADVLRLHPEDPATLVYIGDTEEETSTVFVSRDAGETWHCIDTTVPKVWRLEVVSDEVFTHT